MDSKTLKMAELFGRNLALLRKKNNLTQLQLAKELGVHESTIGVV